MQQSALAGSAVTPSATELAGPGAGVTGESAGAVSCCRPCSGALAQLDRLARPQAASAAISLASAAISLASAARGSRRGASMIQRDIDHQVVGNSLELAA